MTSRDWNHGDAGTEPSLRGVDLADLHAAPRRRRPRWDAPVNSPTPWVFALAVAAAGFLLFCGVFSVLEIAEWVFVRWGG